MTRAARRPGGAAVAAHFRKFEEAGDEELRAMLTSLRDLLGDDAGDDGEGEG
jgi:predicted phosphoribosyltransferase